MSLADGLGAAWTLRLALCSFQYSLQCRSWEWMKRHMSQAWAAHTSSSTQSLQRGRVGGSGGLGPTTPGQGSSQGQEPCPSHGRSPLAPAPPTPPPPPARARGQCPSLLYHTWGGGGGCIDQAREAVSRHTSTSSHTVPMLAGTHDLSLLYPQHKTRLMSAPYILKEFK